MANKKTLPKPIKSISGFTIRHLPKEGIVVMHGKNILPIPEKITVRRAEQIIDGIVNTKYNYRQYCRMFDNNTKGK